MAIYIGFFVTNEDYDREVGRKFRSGEMEPLKLDEYPEPVATKSMELLQSLPAGCKLLGSYVPLDNYAHKGQTPGVMIVETEDVRDIAWLSRYFGGLLTFNWQQYLPVRRQQI